MSLRENLITLTFAALILAQLAARVYVFIVLKY